MINELNWEIGDYLDLVPVLWYGNICGVLMAKKNNQDGEKIKERNSIYDLVMIQICAEHSQKQIAEVINRVDEKKL